MVGRQGGERVADGSNSGGGDGGGVGRRPLRGRGGRHAGAYIPQLFASTSAHFVGYVECMIFPQSIRQRVTGRCEVLQNGLG